MFDFAGKRPFEVPIVVLDTETTGLHVGLGDRVVELGAVRLEAGKPVAQLSQLLQPHFPMSATSTHICQICDADLAGQPTFAEFLPSLLPLLDGALLVAHSAAFDARFLGLELFVAQTNTPLRQRVQLLPNPWLCTYQLARRLFHFGGNSLKHIAYTLGVRVGRTHRALNDVFLTVGVLREMVRELEKRRLSLVDDLLYAQGEPIVTPPPPDMYLPDKLVRAMDNGRLLTIHYQGETMQMLPHYPTHHEGVPYLIGTDVGKGEKRPFRLDLITRAVFA